MDYRSFCCTIVVLGIMQIGLSVFASDDRTRFDIENNRDTLDGITTEYQIVYPQQVKMSEVLPDLSTRDRAAKSKISHFHHTNIELVLSGRRQKIKLDLNKDLLGESLIVETSIDTTRQYREEITVENCYYHGQVKKLMDTQVMVSTCNGIRGVILHRGRAIYIHPLKSRQDKNVTIHPHVLFEAPGPVEELCGNSHGLWRSYQDLHFDQFLRNMKIIKSQEINMFGIVKPLKLGFVVDHTLFQRLNGTVAEALNYSLVLANIMDGLVKDLRLRIRLEYVEVWNDHDLVVSETTSRASLTSFLQYRSKMSTPSFNFLHLLTGVKFEKNEFGMAVPDSICSDRSLAVSQVAEVRDVLRSAVSVTHLLGHVLGIGHDTLEGCSCDDRGKCMMYQKQNDRFDMHTVTWSTCSQKSWSQVELSLLDLCLLDSSTDQPQPGGPVNVKSFQQQCGNGIIERGEECDCIDSECEYLDPCCDQETCLLRSWATCRWGECCHNCTVRPSNQMCRDAAGECDVPEFCDGRTGECPVNALTLDGQQCPATDDGYCYKGICQTYSDQCQRIWGPDASAADDKCFEMFNTAGRFDGHCGWNASSGDMLKCTERNIKCGLLHCSNGTDKPLLPQNWTFSLTHVGSHGANYQCKVLVSDSSHAADIKPAQAYDQSSVAMVSDGTRCGPTSLCIETQCVDVSHVMQVTCPRGPNGLICSKHGVCTTDVRCYCSPGYGGSDCSQSSNWTYIPLTTTTLFPPPPTSAESAITTLPPDLLLPGNLSTTLSHPTTTSVATAITSVQSLLLKERGGTTLWLIVVMGTVVVAASVLLAIVVLCCRRQTPTSRWKIKQDQTGTRRGTGSNVRLSHLTNSSDTPDASTNSRLISFGKLPSYREYKQKRAQRGVSASETESEHSRNAGPGDRSSGEIKSAPPAPTKNPEKGILKNRNNGKAKRRSKELERLSQSGESTAQTVAQIESEGGESVPLAASAEPVVDQSTVSVDPCTERIMPPLEEMESDDDDSSSCCSCEDHDTNASESDARTGRSSGLESIEEENMRADRFPAERPIVDQRQYNGSDKKKAILKDLARQIDSQFHQQTDYLLSREDGSLEVPRKGDGSRRQRSQSPTHSDDRSETEADRCLAPDSFYRQSDSLNRSNLGSAFAPAKPNPSSSPPQRVTTTTAATPLVSSSEAGNRAGSSPRSIELSRKKFFESSAAPSVSNTSNMFSPIQRIGSSTDSTVLPSAVSSRGANPVSDVSIRSSGIPAPQPRRLTSEGRHGQVGSPVGHSTPLAGSSRPDGRASGQHSRHPSNQVPVTTIGNLQGNIPPHNTTSITTRVPDASNPSAKHSALSSAQPSVPYQASTPATTDPHKTGRISLVPGSERHLPSQSILSVFSRPGSRDRDSVSREKDSGEAMRTSTTSSRGSRGSGDGSIVVREIPKNRSFEMRFIPDARGAYTKAPGSPGSPEDIDV